MITIKVAMHTRNYFFFILAAFLLGAHSLVHSAPVITMFMTPYPESCAVIKPDKLAKLVRPDKLAQYHLSTCIAPSVVGVISTYAGFLGISNQMGETIFPLKHSHPGFQVVITPAITPIVMHSNTLSHWELDATKPCAIYSYERITDKQSDMTFWQVKEAEPLKGCAIDPSSIIIIANPKYVYIPIGATLTPASANLILPDIYIKAGIKKVKAGLYWLNISQFFGPLSSSIQVEEKSHRKALK